jgi:hypothetical protein
MLARHIERDSPLLASPQGGDYRTRFQFIHIFYDRRYSKTLVPIHLLQATGSGGTPGFRSARKNKNGIEASVVVTMPLALREASIEIHESRADVIGFTEGQDEYSAIANLSGPGRLNHGLNDVVDFIVFRNYFDHRLRDEVHVIFFSPIQQRLTPLVSVSTNLGYRHAGDQRLEFCDNRIKFAGLDDDLD